MSKKPEKRKKAKKKLSARAIKEMMTGTLRQFDWVVIRDCVRKRLDYVYYEKSFDRGTQAARQSDLEMLHDLLVKVNAIIAIEEPRVRAQKFEI